MATAGHRAVDRRPVRALTVLYDPTCGLCAFAAGWLARQRQLVRIDLVPAGSEEARRRFPALDHAATARDVTVVGDRGQVYRGDSAWIVCLWALADQRALSHTLTTPTGRRLARAAVLSAAKYRGSTRHGSTPHSAAAAPPPGRKTYDIAPGWTYDRVSGWTQAPTNAAPVATGPGPGWGSAPGPGPTAAAGDACTDGCGPDPG
jgi:predicted DCC family thiol-disulfide oxidoreductase YuxK